MFGGKKAGAVIKNDATALDDIADGRYDFVLSSNNLEHIANPLKALLEWKRILKTGGILIIAVPCKKYTFDHKRSVVSFAHLLEDYHAGTGEDDLSHLPEILALHDLSKDAPAGTFEQFKARSLRNFENRCLHQHVFDQAVLGQMLDWLGIERLASPVLYRGNHILAGKK